MARGAKKHQWSLLSWFEGSKVQDVREGDGGGTDQDTLAKISRYNFDRPVRFHGYKQPPNEVPEGMRRKDSRNCVDKKTKNIVLIGREHMDWYLQDDET